LINYRLSCCGVVNNDTGMHFARHFGLARQQSETNGFAGMKTIIGDAREQV